MSSTLFFVETITPLHAGSGRGEGLIDLPITRDVTTKHPILHGSACRGVMRDRFENDNPRDKETGKPNPLVLALFGPDRINAPADAFGGALSFNDAHLIVMPVRSMHGTQAFVTCHRVLQRLQRDARLMGCAGLPTDVPQPHGDSVVLGSTLIHNGHVTLDDFTLAVDAGAAASAATVEWFNYLANVYWADPADKSWRAQCQSRFAVVSDGLFAHFAEYATDVRARNRLDDNRLTVAGALWNEENLPAGSLLAGVLTAQRTRDAADPAASLKNLQREWQLQFGGKFSVGRGAARLIVK